MRNDWRNVAAALGMMTILAGSTARGDGDLRIGQVPVEVRQAALKAVPGASLTSAFKETDEGKTTYELSGKDARGREIDVEVTARGVVLAVETEVPISQVPRAVIDALRAKAKGLKFDSVEVVTRNGRIISYEFEGENAEGDEVEANVSPDGRTVDIEIDDED